VVAIVGNNTLLISPYAATGELTGKDDFFLRTTPSSSFYGEKAAKLLNESSISSVSILIDMSNYSFTGDWASSLQKHFHDHVEKIRFMHREEDTNWTEIINSLIFSDPEAVVILSEAEMETQSYLHKKILL
jgi:ABC-type branched-subunit amino acid transport system substrate-binding protein